VDGASLAQIALFAGTMTVAILSPGPAVIACVRMAAAHGARTAMPYGLGLAFGASLWAAFALAGLTVLFHLVPVLYVALRVAGGLYLLWFAWTLWKGAGAPLPAAARAGGFLKGMLLNLSNPKPAIFYSSLIVAIFPGPLALPAMVAIYLTSLATEIFWYVAMTFAMSVAPVRSVYLGAKVWIDRVAGLALGALGLRLILSPRG
jgi:threonine/homoserine/homoserine lactone efflux protein